MPFVMDSHPIGDKFITRLTVGRVKPLPDLHRYVPVMLKLIPYKVWVWETIPSSSKFLLTLNTSLMLNKVLGLTS